MASLIHEIENNESLLLLYVSGELSAEDTADVEQMLASDAGLRQELTRIESAYTGAMELLGKLDKDRSAIPAENHAVRQAIRAMKQWQVDRLSRQPLILPPPRAKIPGWMYPIGAAAALLIGTISWWGFGGQGRLPVMPTGDQTTDAPAGVSSGIAKATVTPPSADEVIARRLDDSLGTDAPAGDTGNRLADAETQANVLTARSSSDAAASDIFLTEFNP